MQDMLIEFWSKTFGSTHAFDPEEAREYLSKYGIQFKLPNVDPFLNVILNGCWRLSRTRLQDLTACRTRRGNLLALSGDRFFSTFPTFWRAEALCR